MKQSESYKTVKVTAVDGNTITADEGDIVSGGAPGQPGDGSAPEMPSDSGDNSGSSGAPEKPAEPSPVVWRTSLGISRMKRDTGFADV